VALALYDYSDRDSTTRRNQILDIAGTAFTGIFTAECVLKILGVGFIIHPKSYLRDGWNLIDFGVVIAG
jgi:voltage-dependent calcium channel L type alpha-1D